MEHHLPFTFFREGDQYQKVTDREVRPTGSLTPHADAIDKGDFNYYPRGIYDKEPLYIPRYTPSLVWGVVRDLKGPNDSEPPLSDPSAFSMKTGGQLPPRFARYEPPNFAPGPLGPHPGQTYVQCVPGGAIREPKNMAPARYYY